MNIEFLESNGINPEGLGIDFWAKVDGNTIHCTVSFEALQDIMPSNARMDPKLLFDQYKPYLENIAEKKILAHDFNGGKISIITADIRKYGDGRIIEVL